MGSAVGIIYVTVTLSGSTSVQEFAKFFEGFHALHARRRISLRLEPTRALTDPRLLALVVRQAGERRRVVVDVADDPALDEAALRNADVYFKRSFRQSTTERLAPQIESKVQPLGLNNPAITRAAAMRVLRARFRTGRPASDFVRDARQLFALPAPTAFEVSVTEPAEPLIFFQTRLWAPTTTDPDSEAINDERIELVRTLREAFGCRFLGGIVPSDFARQRAPDLITALPWKMRAYPRLLQRPMISVYSRGLQDSLAFKMSEYLAAGRCIVGHVPTTVLPQPLLSETNYLPFVTPEECAAQCEYLLEHPADAAAMRRSNRAYYRQYVEPAAHVQDLLARALRGS